MNQTGDLNFLENIGLVYSASDIITVIVIGLNVSLIIVLNFLCLLVLPRVKNIMDTTKVFLGSLTVSNMTVGIFPGVPTLVLLICKSWPFGEFLCTVHAFFVHYTHAICICSLLLLTVDRYISVVFSLRYPALMTVKRAWIMVCCAWMLMLTAMTVYGFSVNWRYEIVDPILRCGWTVRHTLFYKFTATGFLILAVCIFLTLYARMFVIARRQCRRIANQAHVTQAVTGKNPPNRTTINRSTKTVFIVTVAFLVTVIPAAIILITRKHCDSSFDVAGLLSYGLLLSNSWFNVVVYFLRNGEFKREARQMFPFRLCFTNNNNAQQT